MSIIKLIKNDVEKYILEQGKNAVVQKCVIKQKQFGFALKDLYLYLQKYFPSLLHKLNNPDINRFKSIVMTGVLDSNNILYGFDNSVYLTIRALQVEMPNIDIVSSKKSIMVDDDIVFTFIGPYAIKASNHFRKFVEHKLYIFNNSRIRNEITIHIRDEKYAGVMWKDRVHLNDIILANDVKKDIIQFLKAFKNTDKTYGLMLTGPAGTGKTTIIKSIASHLNMEINIFSGKLAIGQMNTEICSRQSDNKIYVLEDFDKLFEDMESSDIGILMQILDGLITPKHSIFIITSNHPEKFEEIPEMLRKGRIRTKLEINNFDIKLANKFCKVKGLTELETQEFYQQFNITFPVQPSSLNNDMDTYLFNKELAKY